MSALTLYEITGGLLDIENVISELSDDAANNEAVMAALTEALTAHKDALAEKTENYVRVIRNYEALAEVRAAESKRLKESADVALNKAKRLKEALLNAYTALGVDKQEAGPFTVTVANNGGKQPLSVTVEADALPAEYQAITVAPDLDAIRTALLDGKELPFATLQERGKHVRIK